MQERKGRQKRKKWQNGEIVVFLIKKMTISPNRHFYKTPYSKHSKGSSSETKVASATPFA
jgi:hypothetical protein